MFVEELEDASSVGKGETLCSSIYDVRCNIMTLVRGTRGEGGERKDEKKVMVGSKFISGSGSPDGWLCSAGAKPTAGASYKDANRQ